MGGHNGPELGVKINILVPSRFHVTYIQFSVLYKKIRSAPRPPPPTLFILTLGKLLSREDV